MDIASCRKEVFCYGHLNCRSVLKRKCLLYDPLSVALLTDHDYLPIISEAADKYLGRAGTVTVHQHRHGKIYKVSVLGGITVEDRSVLIPHFQDQPGLRRISVLRNRIILHQIIHHLVNNIGKSSRIIPDIKDQALCPLGNQFIHCSAELVCGRFNKLGDLDISISVLQHLIFHRDALDLSPRNIKLQKIRFSFAVHF